MDFSSGTGREREGRREGGGERGREGGERRRAGCTPQRQMAHTPLLLLSF
jgi:hypothetical protein